MRCVPLADVGSALRAFEEEMGIVAPWLFKQAFVQRRCLPSTLPLGHLAALTEQLAVHLDAPQARQRFRLALAPLVERDLQARMTAAGEGA
jgi:hypothetical protein